MVTNTNEILPKINVSDNENNKIKKVISEINKNIKDNLSKYNANFFVEVVLVRVQICRVLK